jgi:hypothetical protein
MRHLHKGKTMNDHQSEELLQLQRELLKEQILIRKEVRAGAGCLILFLFFFGIVCLIGLGHLSKLSTL